ncbi:calcium-transporting ATPase 1 [Lachnospiraceae bacterium]|nr:calcium-transporting ATPase 1 [Lachnospiraceae bacterium]
MRDVNKSIFKMKHLDNIYMMIAWVTGIFLQVLVTEVPYFVALFGTSRLGLTEWAVLGCLSAVPLAVHELLVLSDALFKKSDEKALAQFKEGNGHENGSPQPGEAV